MNPDLGSDTSPVWNIYALFSGSEAAGGVTKCRLVSEA